METLRSIKIHIHAAVDTNKATYVLDEHFEDEVEAAEALDNFMLKNVHERGL